MITTTLFPGRYVQGFEAIKRLGKETARFGSKGFVICDSFVFDTLLPSFQDEMTQHLAITTERFAGECSDEEIERLCAIARKAGCDVIVGVGGGKTMDTAKAVSHALQAAVVISPTIASTDAACSALSVIYTAAGTFKRYLVLPKNPELVLVDTKVIAHAPQRFLVSGMGDALATWFEAESCKKKYAGNMSSDIGSMTAYALAELCYKTLLEFGLLAKFACGSQVVTPAFEHVVEANTLLSGLGFESGGLAAAHAIHNGLTVLEQTHAYFHGEKVAIGTLASLFLTDKPKSTIDEVFGFCESVGLPTTLSDIGLAGITDGQLMKAAKAACAEGETIHNESAPVAPEVVYSALKACDALGRHRKSLS